jgi:hypothetical protein
MSTIEPAMIGVVVGAGAALEDEQDGGDREAGGEREGAAARAGQERGGGEDEPGERGSGAQAAAPGEREAERERRGERTQAGEVVVVDERAGDVIGRRLGEHAVQPIGADREVRRADRDRDRGGGDDAGGQPGARAALGGEPACGPRERQVAGELGQLDEGGGRIVGGDGPGRQRLAERRRVAARELEARADDDLGDHLGHRHQLQRGQRAGEADEAQQRAGPARRPARAEVGHRGGEREHDRGERGPAGGAADERGGERQGDGDGDQRGDVAGPHQRPASGRGPRVRAGW